jgi:hypothetical protein
LLAVLTCGVLAAVQLQGGAGLLPAAAQDAPPPDVVVLPAAEVAPVPVELQPGPAPELTAPAAPAPAATAATEPTAPVAPPPAAPRPAAPAPAAAPADPLCSGAGWEQRRGQAALASLRRPGDAARFRVDFPPGRPDVIGLATVHERRIEVFVRPCADLSTELLRHVVGHEIGHLVDGDRLTDALREEYRAVRGIPAGTPWYGCNSCADFATPAGDFAEVYSQWQRGASTNRSQLAPPSSGQLAEIAARFFS